MWANIAKSMDKMQEAIQEDRWHIIHDILQHQQSMPKNSDGGPQHKQIISIRQNTAKFLSYLLTHDQRQDQLTVFKKLQKQVKITETSFLRSSLVMTFPRSDGE